MAWVAVGASAVSLVGGALLNKKSSDAASRANDAAARSSATQSQIAQDQWDTYKETYQPMEKQYVADAQNYDSAVNQERAAGESSATVASQFGKARDRLSRVPGLDPSSAAFTSAMAGLDMSQAAADAVGQNAARNKVKDMAWARKTDALSLGKGLSAQASAGLAQSASTNMAMANNMNNQANQNGAAFGQLVSNGVNAWNKFGGLDSLLGPTKSTFTQAPTQSYVQSSDLVNPTTMPNLTFG
jgi:HPt (histidine-containing phosphotransfer) domain-containing protein